MAQWRARIPPKLHLECPRRLSVGHTCPEFREQIPQFGCRSARDQFAEREQGLRHPNEPEALACLEPAPAEPVPPEHRLDTFRPHIFHSLGPLTIRASPATFRVVGRLIRDDRHLEALEQATALLKCQADVLVPELFSGEHADFTRSPGRTIGCEFNSDGPLHGAAPGLELVGTLPRAPTSVTLPWFIETDTGDRMSVMISSFMPQLVFMTHIVYRMAPTLVFGPIIERRLMVVGG